MENLIMISNENWVPNYIDDRQPKRSGKRCKRCGQIKSEFAGDILLGICLDCNKKEDQK